MSVESLIREGALEQVRADAAAAERLLADARRHVQSATRLSTTDTNGAYQLAYDAARKAVVAHMTAQGYRVQRRVQGAHAVVARYAEVAVRAPEARHLDQMRRNRNRSEYGAVAIGAAQLAADLQHAVAIVAAVEAVLDPPQLSGR